MSRSKVSQPFHAEEWTVAECLRILRRRKDTLLAITCMGLLGALLVTAVRPRVYQARASLEVQIFNESFLDLRDIYPTAVSSMDTVFYMPTQSELLQQDSLLEQVAQTLHLDRRPEFRPPASPVGKLRHDIRVATLKNSRILQIFCDAGDPQLAADICNTLAGTFIEQSIRARQRAARQTYESLKLQLDDLKRGVLRTSEPPAGEGDDNRRFYEAMLQKADDARRASVIRQSNLRLISPADTPSRPYKPNLPLNLALGTVVGLVLAMARVMLHEQNSTVLQSPGEAGAFLALPEFGAIPGGGRWKSSAHSFFYSANRKPAVERAVQQQPSSHLSESFRSTLASILAGARHSDRPHSFVVTSSRPLEGKTTVASNLGIALAQSGSQVLLIDGNMRRPHLHNVFDQSNDWGLSDILRGGNAINDLPLDSLIRKTAVTDLSLLPGGAATDNILGLLHSSLLARILARFHEAFDYVLLDAPPCLEFADARDMARHAGGLVLVVRANYTERETARAAVQRLESDGIRVTGVILNGWEPSPADLRERNGNWAYDLSSGIR